MKTWAKLAKILKVTKDLDFVVKFATKSIFLSENIDKLIGQKVNLVPPVLDFPRSLTINDITCSSKKIKINFAEALNIDDVSKLEGKWLLLPRIKFREIFDDASEIDFFIQDFIGKKVIDKKEGDLGYVDGVEGSDFQKVLIVVDSSNNEILIPYVDDIVIDTDDSIIVDCPEGLITLNK